MDINKEKRVVIEVWDKDGETILFQCEVAGEDEDKSIGYLLSNLKKGEAILPYNAFGRDDRTIWFRLRQLHAGLKYGYPICCILDYCFSERPGWKYGGRTSKTGGRYVPCRLCENKET